MDTKVIPRVIGYQAFQVFYNKKSFATIYFIPANDNMSEGP